MSVVDCPVCGAPISWVMTVHGALQPFDYPPVPAALDILREGWVPGTWVVRGRRRIVFAPVVMSSPAKQDRVVTVVLPHVCRRPAK